MGRLDPGLVAGDDAGPLGRAVVRALLDLLAEGPSRIVIPALEDLWLETAAQNIPGTLDHQHPNWRRRARYTLEEFRALPEVVEALGSMHRARSGGHAREDPSGPHRLESRGSTEASSQATTLLTDQDLYLFNEGTHTRLGERMGGRLVEGGTAFAVWAPSAKYVSAVGDFNGWDRGATPLTLRGESGIWEGFAPGVGHGAVYKFHVASKFRNYNADKADPYALFCQASPETGSVVWDLSYAWGDGEWMAGRTERNALDAPIAAYEVHLGSWRRAGDHGERFLSYRELADALPDYCRRMGFTHVELLPVMEHPFYGSWGYQATGYYAPTSRYGAPQDFMWLVDALHQAGIGVLLDWPPAHFPDDEHGLGYFDGTYLYEHADPRQRFHPEWRSLIFNFGRNEVRSFLLSSAMHWLSTYHADGIRVDAVASMLYLDYARKAGSWVPNRFGGRENLDAVDFVRTFNRLVYQVHPDVQTMAEESTDWPGVSRPLYVGGLGFGLKWDLGWMHDTLDYLKKDPIHRKYHHTSLTFRQMYASSENFVLPLSHDEVVHMKGSLLSRMPGDGWQQLANLRLLLAYQWAQNGKKLLFMGGEFGQRAEWDHDRSLDWHLLEDPAHAGIQRMVADLNRLYRDLPALHEGDEEPKGFEWIDANDSEASVLTFLRWSHGRRDAVVVACNFTPVVRYGYRVGVPRPGRWRELLNSDGGDYGGSGVGNEGGVDSEPTPSHGRPSSLSITLPPLAAVFFASPHASEDVADEEAPSA
jgi:1,4-alpha-glucan branching enzyme